MTFVSVQSATEHHDMHRQPVHAYPTLTTWTEPQHETSGAYASSHSTEEPPDEADDGVSSCNSGDSEPDLSDMAALPENTAGEQLYLAYRHAKRRWRSFTGGYKRLHYRRFGKGKGRGKGRMKGKAGGKGFPGCLLYTSQSPRDS